MSRDFISFCSVLVCKKDLGISIKLFGLGKKSPSSNPSLPPPCLSCSGPLAEASPPPTPPQLRNTPFKSYTGLPSDLPTPELPPFGGQFYALLSFKCFQGVWGNVHIQDPRQGWMLHDFLKQASPTHKLGPLYPAPKLFGKRTLFVPLWSRFDCWWITRGKLGRKKSSDCPSSPFSNKTF